jgi:hypothetical protein
VIATVGVTSGAVGVDVPGATTPPQADRANTSMSVTNIRLVFKAFLLRLMTSHEWIGSTLHKRVII